MGTKKSRDALGDLSKYDKKLEDIEKSFNELKAIYHKPNPLVEFTKKLDYAIINMKDLAEWAERFVNTFKDKELMEKHKETGFSNLIDEFENLKISLERQKEELGEIKQLTTK